MNCTRRNETGEIIEYGSDVRWPNGSTETVCLDVGELIKGVPKYYHKLVANSIPSKKEVLSYESYDFHIEEMTTEEKFTFSSKFTFSGIYNYRDICKCYIYDCPEYGLAIPDADIKHFLLYKKDNTLLTQFPC